MKQLTQEYLKSIFTYENGNLIWKHNRANNKIKAGTIAGSIDISNGYIHINILGKRYKAHRLIYTYHYGEIDYKMQIDHIDRIRHNNLIENLRVVTRQENSFNNNARGYSYNKSMNKYQAYIRLNGKLKTLGTFDNEEEARKTYLEAKNKVHTFNNSPELEILDKNKALGYCFIKSRNKFLAQIRLNGKRKFLGYFNTKEEASEAYLKAKSLS